MRRTILLAAAWLVFSSAASAAPPERTAMIGTGRSMWPTLPECCRLVVMRIPFEQVKVGPRDGDIISTRLGGLGVVHRAIARLADGSIVTQGDNNPCRDGLRTTELNYVGVVIGFERPGSIGELVAPQPLDPFRHVPKVTLAERAAAEVIRAAE